jgi:hypothetical protein
VIYARKMNLAKKPEPNLQKLLLKNVVDFRNLILRKEPLARKRRTLQNETACPPELWLKTTMPILET